MQCVGHFGQFVHLRHVSYGGSRLYGRICIRTRVFQAVGECEHIRSTVTWQYDYRIGIAVGKNEISNAPDALWWSLRNSSSVGDDARNVYCSEPGIA